MIGHRHQYDPRETAFIRRVDKAAVLPRVVAVAHPKRHYPGPLAVLVLVGLGIEMLLALRLWIQMAEGPVTGLAGSVMAVSSWFASPFGEMESTPPIKQTGILDISTVAAMEFYLALSLTLVVLILVRRHVLSPGWNFVRSQLNPVSESDLEPGFRQQS